MRFVLIFFRLAYFSLGNYTEAVQSYKQALELDPNNATLRESLEAAEKKAGVSGQVQV